MKRILIMAMISLISLHGFSQEQIYKASKFSIRSDGKQDNTTSIQGAVDYIADQGGGTLEFSVGRYRTGAVELKSGVNIKLLEGAIIVGSTNIYSYKGKPGIFWAEGQRNIIIDGRGVFDGRGAELRGNEEEQKSLGHIPENHAIPALMSFKDCEGIVVKGIVLRNPATEDPILSGKTGVEVQDVSIE
ncbi:MAG: hypothetical protein PUK70_08750 [Bacteroidales bacterium]|nr:hypothetical protein [Bacteroidales bacterium]MDY6000988.1 hypothetical protein [Candidatus Cryptobacteroides sp.]